MKRSEGFGKKGSRFSGPVIILFWAVILILVLYPLWLIVIASVSDPNAVIRGNVLLLPVDFSLVGYKAVFEYKELMTGYLNSVLYTTVGASLSVIVTMLAAYVLTRSFRGKKAVTVFILITMFFSGGLIPIYLNIRNLHLYNTRSVMVLMNLVSVWNLMVAKMYIKRNIPQEMFDSALMDGADHFTIFTKIVMPLSRNIIVVLAVYYGVARWNDYFTGMIMLRDSGLFPLQLVLKDILTSYNSIGSSAAFFESYANSMGSSVETALRLADVAKYCCIVIAAVPPVTAFLITQKFFSKGVMMGSIKG